MTRKLTFDDVLIQPCFSDINSRSEIDVSSPVFNIGVPVFSANMQSITEHEMANVLDSVGAMGVLHRFSTIEENVNMFNKCKRVAVSIGVTPGELNRAEALLGAGAKMFFIDVAHGAQKQTADTYKILKNMGVPFLVLGNLASLRSLLEFQDYVKMPIDAIKIGIGPGSACTTRIKTGVGYPQLSAIMDMKAWTGCPSIIADGGIKSPGDVAKALAAGADAVMIGGMFAGTKECPDHSRDTYSGSASMVSYEKQGKASSWRTPEGETFKISANNKSAEDIVKDIEGGLRSSFSYVGARNLKEFQEKAEFIEVSQSSIRENGAHFNSE